MPQPHARLSGGGHPCTLSLCVCAFVCEEDGWLCGKLEQGQHSQQRHSAAAALSSDWSDGSNHKLTQRRRLQQQRQQQQRQQGQQGQQGRRRRRRQLILRSCRCGTRLRWRRSCCRPPPPPQPGRSGSGSTQRSCVDLGPLESLGISSNLFHHSLVLVSPSALPWALGISKDLFHHSLVLVWSPPALPCFALHAPHSQAPCNVVASGRF